MPAQVRNCHSSISDNICKSCYSVYVKKVAKLFLYFSVTFSALFLLAAGLGFLHVWIDAASAVPARSFIYLADFIPSAEWALPFTLYVTILMSMSYACRTKIPAPGAFAVLFILAFGFTYSVSLGVSHAKAMIAPPSSVGYETLGKAGLILSGHGTTVVLLDNPAKAEGERVVSLSDRPLFYQPDPVDADGKPIPLPSIPFKTKNVALFESLMVDFSLAAKELSARFAHGFESFAAYTGAIIFILLSLVTVLDIGAWPLANIFIGAVLFRLVLSFEVFICGRDTLEYLTDFLGRWIPAYLVAPFIIGVAGVLLAVYSGLVSAARVGEHHHG
jgi:hypothetical protein